MPLDPTFATMLDTLESAGALPLVRGTAVESREHYRTLALSRRGPDFVPEEVASVVEDTADGAGGPVPVRIYRPATDAGTVVLWLHGGGWVLGDLDTHDPLCRRVANALGAVVVSADYRLAPEHPHPAPLDDAETALRAVASWFPDRPIGVAGDSAGASLAAGLALRARDGGPPVAAQLLFYPSTDPTQSQPSTVQNGTGYFLTASDMRWFYEQYLPGGSSDPQVDLLRADVRGVAPAVVATAEFDPLRDEGLRYADLLEGAGVAVRRIRGPGLIHGYAAFLGVVDAAEKAADEALGGFGELLSTG